MRLYRLNTSPSSEGLTICEEPTPKPRDSEILVKIRATSINRRDVMIASGAFRHSVAPGLVPLSDAAGEVVEVGASVSRVKIGDRVCGSFYPTWISGSARQSDGTHGLGGGDPGVLAEYRVFDQQAVVSISSYLSFEEAATLPCAALTAWNALFGGQALRAGETVLILGTGDVSVFALQFAQIAGAATIVASSSDAKLVEMHKLGATHPINYKTSPKWEHAVREVTDGNGADHVIDVVGGDTLSQSILASRFGGQVHMVGAQPSNKFDPRLILLRNVCVRGVMVGSRSMFEAMSRTMELHAVRPVIGSTHAFEAAAEAYKIMSNSEKFGKAVIQLPS